MRSAEKKRTSTCKFADEIARLSITKYKSICPNAILESYQQTVLSSIILENLVNHELTVVSFGVGTKYMKYRYHDAHTKKLSKQYLSNIRDCHAEILARRGFLLYLYREIEYLYQYSIDLLKVNEDIDISAIQTPILEFDVPSILLKRNSMGNMKTSQFRVKVRDHIRFHLYSSSSPCGNSCIKRWAKGQTIHTLNLDINEYPAQPHPRLYVTAPQEGQTAILLKKGSGSEMRYIDNMDEVSYERNEAISSLSLKILPIVDDYSYTSPQYPENFIPPGTIHLPSYPLNDTAMVSGLSMTCSDKITVWNALGIQGSLLSHLLSKPIYLTTITIGRKYSVPHVYRGLCCRVQDFQYPQESPVFSCNHPVILCTSEKLDDGAIITSRSHESETNDSTTIGANFEDIRCLCYSRHILGNDQSRDETDIFDVINGETGMLLDDFSQSSSFSSMSLYQNYMKCEALKALFFRICMGNEDGEEMMDIKNLPSVSEYLLVKKVGYPTVEALVELHMNGSNLEEYSSMNQCNLSSYSDGKHRLLTSKKSNLRGWLRTTTLLNSEQIENSLKKDEKLCV